MFTKSVNYATVMAHAISWSLGGLPQCSHCHTTFTTWRGLQIHLERNCCEANAANAPVPVGLLDSPVLTQVQHGPLLTEQTLSHLMSKEYGTQLLRIVRTRVWNELRPLSAALEDLRHHCVLCGSYHGCAQELNSHLRLHHGQLLPHTLSKMAQLCHAQASIAPCALCSKHFQKNHMCPVLTQVSLLLLYLDRVLDSDRPTPDAALHCEVCLAV